MSALFKKKKKKRQKVWHGDPSAAMRQNTGLELVVNIKQIKDKCDFSRLMR